MFILKNTCTYLSNTYYLPGILLNKYCPVKFSEMMEIYALSNTVGITTYGY